MNVEFPLQFWLTFYKGDQTEGANYTQNLKAVNAAWAIAQPNPSHGSGQTIKPTMQLAGEAKHHQAHYRGLCIPPTWPFGFEGWLLTSLAPPPSPLRRRPAHTSLFRSICCVTLHWENVHFSSPPSKFPSLSRVLHLHCPSGAIWHFRGAPPGWGFVFCKIQAQLLHHHLGCLLATAPTTTCPHTVTTESDLAHPPFLPAFHLYQLSLLWRKDNCPSSKDKTHLSPGLQPCGPLPSQVSNPQTHLPSGCLLGQGWRSPPLLTQQGHVGKHGVPLPQWPAGHRARWGAAEVGGIHLTPFPKLDYLHPESIQPAFPLLQR